MIRNKVKCEVCNKLVSSSNYTRHYQTHFKKIIDTEYHVDHEGLNCKFCNKECKNLKSLTQHELRCSKNPNRKAYIVEGFNNKGNKPWNTGLTKDTDERMLLNSIHVSDTMKNKVESGWIPYFASDEFWTADRRKQRSEEKKQLYKEHPEKHPNRLLAGNKNYRTYPESIAYNWLVSHNILFEEQYLTKFNDNQRYVDFYLPDYKLYIEIDGEYWHKDTKDRDKEKDLYAKDVQGINTLRISAKDKIEDILENYFKSRDVA